MTEAELSPNEFIKQYIELSSTDGSSDMSPVYVYPENNSLIRIYFKYCDILHCTNVNEDQYSRINTQFRKIIPILDRMED